jgi:hypothetical protein
MKTLSTVEGPLIWLDENARADIAYRCGLTSQSQFTRVCHAHYRQTLGEVRENRPATGRADPEASQARSLGPAKDQVSMIPLRCAPSIGTWAPLM